MAGQSTGAVVYAIVGNGFLTVLKFVAFVASGSGAMLSEALHSFADTSNQALLFMGIRRSEGAPTAMFPYGHGVERYFFALMSAVGIFVLGCGVTIYHGIRSLIDPHELELRWWIFAVLAISFAVEFWVLIKAWQAVKVDLGGRSLREFADANTDPTALAVLLEDGAACLGVLVAVVGIGLAQITGNPMWDAIGSIVIGIMLGLVAIVIGWQNRRLILGRRIPLHIRKSAVEYLNAQPSVDEVKAIQSRVLGAGNLRLKAEVEFDGAFLGRSEADWVREKLPAKDDADSVATFSADFGARVIEKLGDEIDRIEGELQNLHPELKHIDFETD